MDKFRKFGLRVSFATVTLGIIFWCAGFFSNDYYEDFYALAIYLLVASVLFASPYMIITQQKPDTKTRLETYADLGVSGFYTAALIFVLLNAIPYFNSGETTTTLQLIGQTAFVISFLWTLCVHGWSTLSSFAYIFKTTEN